MVSLKRQLKQILVHRQHKLYERELISKNLTYDEWITSQEERLNISTIRIFDKKKLINDSETKAYEWNELENESNNSKIDGEYELWQAFDESGQYFRGTMTVLCASALYFCKRAEALLQKYCPDVVVLSAQEGRVSDIAVPLICQAFGNSENTLIIYGDEDRVKDGGEPGARGVRENPWFKPDWSPDRFLSSFYFGALAAFRTKAILDALPSVKSMAGNLPGGAAKDKDKSMDGAAWLYALSYEILKDTCAFEKGHDYEKLPVRHIRQVLFHSLKDGREQTEGFRLPERMMKEVRPEEKPLLSVIIPSKDNPEALFYCLDSLTERTRSSCPFEIVLVDNGSREENRQKILRKVQELNGRSCLRGCRYYYKAMPFNFSAMCNLGAEKAEGELFLFLNDDMEIVCPDWLDKMADKALLPYAGAVGAKLLYPGSDIIQHAGITNLRVGPAHKLQFLSDEKVHYFGMNRGVHNMLAVTGACLMMRKDVFAEAGGFCETLAVAFNDVDLCYTVFEKGYYNIVRNDVMLYHHESLSRGNDGDSPEKQLRLLSEKDTLYERHQPLYGKDPFYHPYLTTDMLEQAYSPAYRYQVTLDMPWSEAVLDTGVVGKAREDKCLVVGMECAMDIFKWKYGVPAEHMPGIFEEKGEKSPEKDARRSESFGDTGYYFQGYSFIIGADNACYKKNLLLKNKDDGRVWQIPVDNRYRPDIKNNLQDQQNVDLTGFAAKLKKNAVPEGVYQFGMLAEDKCSRLKLVNWSNWVLEVRTDGKTFG